MMLWNQLREENILTYADEKEEKARGTRFQLEESMLHQKDQAVYKLEDCKCGNV